PEARRALPVYVSYPPDHFSAHVDFVQAHPSHDPLHHDLDTPHRYRFLAHVDFDQPHLNHDAAHHDLDPSHRDHFPAHVDFDQSHLNHDRPDRNRYQLRPSDAVQSEDFVSRTRSSRNPLNTQSSDHAVGSATCFP